MVFHEITRAAIDRAVRDFRDLDRRLVDAQEARRILDRLYGYEVSPVLWKKVMPRLSAGRVQSVATRLLVERERARMRFRAASYWDIDGTFDGDKKEPFGATLVALDGTRLATGKDFGEDGTLTATSPVVRLDQEGAEGLAARLADTTFEVRSLEQKPYRRSPYPPFMTSTLQQEAGRKLRFSSSRTMQVAQRLYENGYITYMRTDSTTLSEQALSAARDQARTLYGANYVPDAPRRYNRKVKNAQEAHEAIRPSGETSFRRPEQTGLSGDELRLYDLIWKRTIASQMADARGQSVQLRIGGRSSAGEDAEFGASGKTIEFPGFLRAYVEGSDDPDAALEDQEVRLPALASRRPATPRPRWSRPWRSWASAGPRPTPASSARSRNAATCGNGGRRWCRRGSPLPWWACSSSTSPPWWTTASPPGWKTSSTRSPKEPKKRSRTSTGSTSATRAAPAMATRMARRPAMEPLA
jgi:DNA topoisomerase-1